MIIPVDNLNQPGLQFYAQRRESELKHACEPAPGYFIAESMKVIRRALEAGYAPVSFLCSGRNAEELHQLLRDTEIQLPMEGQLAGIQLDGTQQVGVQLAGTQQVGVQLAGTQQAGAEIPVFTADETVLEQIAGYHLTGGALSLMRRREYLNPDIILSGAADQSSLPVTADQCSSLSGETEHHSSLSAEAKHSSLSVTADQCSSLSAEVERKVSPASSFRRIAVLEHVVNPTNLGAIVRSAAALGMDAVLFTPDCADPLYRRAIRVSMGTIFQIPWTFTGHDPEDWYQNGVRTLKECGWHTVAMALREDSCVPDDPRFQTYEKLAVIVGTEGEGLAEETIRYCDDTVMIPMTHGVDSLNVGAAAAVAFWNFGRKN